MVGNGIEYVEKCFTHLIKNGIEIAVTVLLLHHKRILLVGLRIIIRPLSKT